MTNENINKIPKIIHYCWFGDKEKPELVQMCINSWKTQLSDYEIREWNNEDLSKCTVQFVQDAAEAKKWAFVADYFRFYAVYNFGGIYFDTDHEVVSNLDKFLKDDFFTGYENASGSVLPFASLFGAKPKHQIVEDMLHEYENSSFIIKGEYNLKTVNQRFTDLLSEKYNFKKPYNENKTVEFAPNSFIYPSNYFCKEDSKYVIHHFAGSWVDDVRNFWTVNFPFGFNLKFYICKEETKKDNKLPEDEFVLIKFRKNKKRYIVITIGQKRSKQ